MSDEKTSSWSYTRKIPLGVNLNWPFDSHQTGIAYYNAPHSGTKISSGHPYVAKLHSHTGGYFFLNKTEVSISGSPSIEVFVSGKPMYIGQVNCLYAGTANMPSKFNDPAYYYNEAWNRARPAKPSWKGLNAVYELKDVPNMLKDSFNTLFRHINDHHSLVSKLGQHHVAIQFGWLPLLSDVRSFVHLQRNGQKIVKQLIKDNGRPVRRSGILHSYSNSYQVPGFGNSDFSPLFVSQAYARAPSGTRQYDQVDVIRYSGRFKYWLPPGPRDVQWTQNILRRIYGFRVTPKVVYDAIPWSWLVDWFSNLGDFIQTVSPGVEDRLASDYFFVTRYTHTKSVCSGTVHLKTRGGVKSVSSTATNISKRIVRVTGSLFAPELTGHPGLSAMQTSILAGIQAQKYK